MTREEILVDMIQNGNIYYHKPRKFLMKYDKNLQNFFRKAENGNVWVNYVLPKGDWDEDVEIFEYLKTCPFCGGKSKLHTWVADCGNNDKYYIMCNSCESESLCFDTRVEAIQFWNKRVESTSCPVCLESEPSGNCGYCGLEMPKIS